MGTCASTTLNALIVDAFDVFSLFEQKAGDKHQLYIRKLRETPKAYSTAVYRKQ